MTAPRPTPGPWQTAEAENHGFVYVVTPEQAKIDIGSVCLCNEAADATLIAATWELADALKLAIKLYDDHEDDDSTWVALGRAALAKAGL